MNTTAIIMLAIGLVIAMTSLGIGLVIAIGGYREYIGRAHENRQT